MSTMNSERPRPEYGCGQQDLYTVCDTIAISLEAHTAAFEAYSTNYTSTSGPDLRGAVKSARELPDEAQREADHSILRKELVDMKDSCLEVWQQLTSYIRDGFDKEVYKEQLNAAGHGYYASAQNEDWDDVNGLMQAGAGYISDNAAKLTGGGMPTGFDVTFDTAKSNFAVKYEAFLQSLEASKVATDEKVNANNKIYRDTVRVCEDGKRIFRKSAAVREEFTFDVVLALVRSNVVKHGVSGLVTQAVDGSVVGQVDVLLEKLLDDGTYSETGNVLTDNAGMYKFNGIADGDYRLTVSKSGFVTQQRMIVVDGGPVEEDFVLVSG